MLRVTQTMTKDDSSYEMSFVELLFLTSVRVAATFQVPIVGNYNV